MDEGGSVAVAELALWKGSAEQIDRWARMQQEETRAIVERHAGRAFWLANREKGEAVTLSLHESGETAKALYEEALQIRRRIIETTGCEVTHAGAYEVVILV